MGPSYIPTGLFFLVVLAGLLRSAESIQDEFATKEMVDNILREIQNLKANVTDELEERIEVLEDTVEELENEDALINIRLFDIEIDVFDNENAIEELVGRADTTDMVLLNQTAEINDLVATDTELQVRINVLEETVNAPWIACESSPCDNGATCVDVNVDNFICSCRDGYFGVRCSESYLNTVFLASISTDESVVTDPIVFDLTPVNYGESYDSTTGIYTVPMNGLYEFSVQIYCILNENSCVYYISVDGILATDTPFALADTPNGRVGVATTVVLELSQGQQVWISPGDFVYDVKGAANGMASWFAGQLLMAY